MAISVSIPFLFWHLTDQKKSLEFGESKTVRDILATLFIAYPLLVEQIRDSNGRIRRSLNVFVNGVDICFLDGEYTFLNAGDKLEIVPAMASG